MTNPFRVVEHDPGRRVKFTSTGGRHSIRRDFLKALLEGRSQRTAGPPSLG